MLAACIMFVLSEFPMGINCPPGIVVFCTILLTWEEYCGSPGCMCVCIRIIEGCMCAACCCSSSGRGDDMKAAACVRGGLEWKDGKRVGSGKSVSVGVGDGGR